MKFNKYFKGLLLFCIIVFCVLFIRGKVTESVQYIVNDITKKNYSHPKTFLFRLRGLGIIPLGTIRIENKGLAYFGGKKLLYLTATVQSYPFYYPFGIKYKMNLQSYVKQENFYPVFFKEETVTSKGGLPGVKDIFYDQDNLLMKGPKGTHKIMSSTKDPLGLFFYFLSQRLEIGRDFQSSINTNKNNYLIEIKPLSSMSYKADDKNFEVINASAAISRMGNISERVRGISIKKWLLKQELNLPLKISITIPYNTHLSFFDNDFILQIPFVAVLADVE